MTLNKIILTICFLFISILGFSQHKEYYFFDSNWKPVTSNDYYSYYRVVNYSNKGFIINPIILYNKDHTVRIKHYADQFDMEAIRTNGTGELGAPLGMINGKAIIGNQIFYYRNGELCDGKPKSPTSCDSDLTYTNHRVFSHSKKDNSKITAGEVLAGVAVIGGLIYALSGGDDDSSSSSSNSTPQYNMSENNVSIISWGTYGSLAYPHASATIRNKNNYDVIVSIKVKQGSWKNSSLHSEMSDMSGYDYSENYNEEFKIKANSVRKVALRGNGRGRPTDIGFRYVN